MGFGPLLIGYLITYIISLGLGNYLFAAMLVGGFIMFLALCELRKYSPAFLYAIIACVLMILCSFYKTAAFIDDTFMLGLGLTSETMGQVFDWV